MNATDVKITHISGSTNPADALTKATSYIVLENLRSIITRMKKPPTQQQVAA